MSFYKLVKLYFFGFFIFFNIQKVFAQTDSLEWFPDKGLFPFLEYDLLELKPYTGVFVLKAEEITYDGVYIPVNIGFRKSLLQWSLSAMRLDVSFGVASYTQFEIIRFDANTLRGGLLNTDFKVSGLISSQVNHHRFRLHLFHVSSHVGDDYILRNQYFETNDKSVNYEQVDFTYMYRFKFSDIYIGAGGVIGTNAFRKRFMTEIGYQASLPIKQKFNITYGCDVKFYDENDFIPDIHAGAGIQLKKKEHLHFNFSLDAYYGSLPYSTLDFGTVYWMGLSTSVYL